jgi:cation:H+ antiporter
MILHIALLIIGLVILIYGANFLVDGGSALAHRLKVSAMVIGLTIVAFGTSAPELVVNLVSSIEGNSAIALGNVVGSNIFNILAILGITALLVPLGVNKTTTWIEVPLALFAAGLLLLLTDDTPSGIISRTEGICLLGFFIIFLLYTFALAKFGGAGNGEEVEIKNYSIKKSVLFIILGLAGLIAGGRMLVYGAVHIAELLGISERIIGLTIVSIGTSLPELATSIIAARKNNADIAIGNVVGSNIFNTFLILGASATLSPLRVPQGSSTDLIINIVASALLFLFIFTGSGRKINRWEGVIFFLIYIGYLVYIIHNA